MEHHVGPEPLPEGKVDQRLITRPETRELDVPGYSDDGDVALGAPAVRDRELSAKGPSVGEELPGGRFADHGHVGSAGPIGRSEVTARNQRDPEQAEVTRIDDVVS